MSNTKISYLTLSQEDLINAGAFDLQMAIKALKEGLFKYQDGGILFPDKIVQIFNEEIHSPTSHHRFFLLIMLLVNS